MDGAKQNKLQNKTDSGKQHDSTKQYKIAHDSRDAEKHYKITNRGVGTRGTGVT